MKAIRLPLLAALLVATLLGSGCGGGGGGGGAQNPPATPPTATIESIAPGQRVAGTTITFAAAAGQSVTYSWSFGDGASGLGGSASHVYAAPGNYTVVLTVSGAGGSATASQTIAVLGPPSVPLLTLSTFDTRPGVAVSMSATSTDPQGSALTYSWEFGDGTTASGASVAHTYTSEGQFAPRVTASNTFALSASSTANSIRVAYLGMGRPSIFAINENHILGHAYVARAAAMEPNGFPLTFAWDFGDGSPVATDLYSHHTYAATGTYTVTFTATSSLNRTVSRQTIVNVLPPGSLPARSDNVLSVFCAGTFCGAANATTYSGTGAGIWRYHNATASSVALDIAISGVHAGQLAALTFTNAQAVDAADVPGVGTLTSLAAPRVQAAGANRGDNGSEPSPQNAHIEMLERNLASARELAARRAAAPQRMSAKSANTAVAAKAAPAVGSTRMWIDVMSGSTYEMEVAATCTLSTGRNAAFWLDSAQIAAGKISRAKIDYLVTGFCGPSGGYTRLVALVGDLWGPAATASGYIEDAPGNLLDVNVVMPGVPDNTSWGGYFSAANLTPSSSNAALALFVNPRNVVFSPDPDAFVGSTLIHELKHHINFYQRAVARGRFHAPWLEETSAMLAEDAVTPAVFGASRSEARLGGYVTSGGNVGYLGWTEPQGQSYNLGGTLAGLLHRYYGLDVDPRLIDTCNDQGTALSSYQCVDALIVSLGGPGFADDFERLGATVFGGVGRSEMPTGFGLFPIERAGVFFDSLDQSITPFPPPRPLTNGYLATLHTYRHDTIGAGQTVYKRDGVVVPAGTTLILVIQ